MFTIQEVAKLQRKKAPFRIFVKILIILAIIQGLIVIGLNHFNKQTPPTEVAEEDALSEEEYDRQLLTKMHAAVLSYMASTGAPPKKLELLIPTQIDKVPYSRVTGRPFYYQAFKKLYILLPKAPNDPGNKGLMIDILGSYYTPEHVSYLVKELYKDGPEEPQYIYDPVKKRDPFRTYFADLRTPKPGATALERYELGQLKYTAFLEHSSGASAIVEDLNGKGHIVFVGTKVGLFDGEIIEITPEKIKVHEVEKDLLGKEKVQVREIPLQGINEPRQ